MADHPERSEDGARPPVRTVVVDDHEIVRAGYHALLVGSPVEIVGEAGTALEGLRLVDELTPDIVLMDMRLPDLDGVEATRKLREKHPTVPVVIVTSFDSTEYLRHAIDAGASGFVLKGASREHLLEVIESVSSGGAMFSPALLADLLRDSSFREAVGASAERSLNQLSEREMRVLRLVANGLTNQQIAVELDYSVGTIKNDVQSIIEKLRASDRTHAAVIAVRNGLELD